MAPSGVVAGVPGARCVGGLAFYGRRLTRAGRPIASNAATRGIAGNRAGWSPDMIESMIYRVTLSACAFAAVYVLIWPLVVQARDALVTIGATLGGVH